MKTIRFALLFSAVIIFGSCVMAPTPAAAQTVADKDFCELFAVSAAATMEMRQAGKPIEDSLRNARESGVAIERMIQDAYEVPVAKGRQAKAYEVSKFETRYFISCMNYMVRK